MQHHRLEFPGNCRNNLARGARRFGHLLHRQGQRGVRAERDGAREHLVKNNPEAVNVRCRSQRRGARALFRRHVTWRADDRAHLRQCLVIVIIVFVDRELGDAKVQHLDHRRQVRALLNENVCRLQIPMNQLRVVRRAHRRARLQHERHRARGIERRFVRQQVAQRATFEQFHHDVEPAVFGCAKVVHRNGIGMMHATSRARFAAKPFLRRLVADEPLAENLYGHRTIDQQMSCAIDRAHAATAERLLQTILAVEHLADQRIDRNIRDGVVGPQRREVIRTDVHIVGKLPATSGALKHD